MKRKKMEKIKNLEDLKYRKLLIRTEIFKKEQLIKRQLVDLKTEIKTPGIKNEIIKGILDNPSLIINVARLTFKLVQGWKKRKNRKKSKK